MKRVIKITIITILSFILLVASLPVLLFGLTDGIECYKLLYKGLSVTNPPKPKVTYGEFPFTLVYEINGEEKIIEDTLICKYDGVQWVGDFVYATRSWKESFKSGNKRIELLQIDETTVIYYPARNVASYYMGETTSGAIRYSENAGIADPRDAYGYDWSISAEELLNNYNIRIISWEIAPPITNSFH